MSLKRGGGVGDGTMVEKYLIPNIALKTILIDCQTRGGVGEGVYNVISNT